MHNTPTLMVVDDTHESLALLNTILTAAGYRVRPAHSGRLALASVAAHPPDLILLDIRMPGMDGLEVCQRLKADEASKHIPIILVSAHAQSQEWLAGLRLGAADYITKPFQAEELLARVRVHLELSQTHLALKQQAVELRQANQRLQVEIGERQALEDELRQSLALSERSRQEMRIIAEEQTRLEQTLHENQRFLADLVDNSGALVFVKNCEGHYSLVNRKWEEVTGLQRQEVLGKTDEALFPEVSGRQFRLHDLEVMRLGTLQESEEVLDTPLGRRFFISIKFPLRDAAGKVGGVCGMATEITERKLAEEALRENEERFRAMVETIPLAIVLSSGVEKRIPFVNSEFTKLFGYTLADVPTVEHWWPLAYPDEHYRHAIAAEWNRRVAQAISTPSSIEPMEVVVTCKDGSKKDISWSYITLGAIRYAFGLDVTKRKQAEKERARLLYILESSLNEIYVFAADSLVFEYVNRGACRNLGYTLDTLKTMKPLDLEPEFTEASFRRLLAPLLRHEQQRLLLETVHRRADGSLYPVEAHLQVIELEGQQLFLAVVQDISERKRTRAERERLIAAIEQTREVIVMADTQGAIQYANPAFEKTTGYALHEVLRHDSGMFTSGMGDEALSAELWETIASGRTWSGRMVNKHKDGRLYTEEATISPVFDGTGEIVSYIAVKRDITDQLKLEAQFLQAQKMESVGRLTGGVAHDFNNILSVILGYTDLSMELVAPPHPLHENLTIIREATQRSADIVRQLMAFSRQQAIAPRVLDLNDTVAGMLHMLRRMIGESINLVWLPAPELPLIQIDPSQVDQILANLCVNARDAIDGVGSITIGTQAVTLAEQNLVGKAEVLAGEYVALSVSDDGCGMDQAIVDKIFEPFFTTKEVGQGTGLGLATVYGIVKQNNGAITVDSEPGHGATFTLYLPCLSGQSLEEPEARAEEVLAGSRKALLLVEDDPPVLKMAAIMLREAGYRVLTASTPSEALRLAAHHPGIIDLLITDVIMPEMNGRELSDQLIAAYPGLKRLYISGYTADIIGHHGVFAPGVSFLAKPFSKQELYAKIKEVLAG